MGVVWGAFDPELERRVAIKLVRAKESSSRERILLEGQALAKLSHPNVVTVHDVGVGDDGRVRVLDFGLALDREDGDDGAVAGTPRYMAPEQQRGEVTEAVDLFA